MLSFYLFSHPTSIFTNSWERFHILKLSVTLSIAEIITYTFSYTENVALLQCPEYFFNMFLAFWPSEHFFSRAGDYRLHVRTRGHDRDWNCWFGEILSELGVCRQAQRGLHRVVSLPSVLFLHIVFLCTFCCSNDSLCLKAVILNSEKAPKPKNTPWWKEQENKKN